MIILILLSDSHQQSKVFFNSIWKVNFLDSQVFQTIWITAPVGPTQISVTKMVTDLVTCVTTARQYPTKIRTTVMMTTSVISVIMISTLTGINWIYFYLFKSKIFSICERLDIRCSSYQCIYFFISSYI